LQRQEAAEALEVELARREQIVSEREAVLASREGLQLRQLRTSLSLRHSIDGVSEQLAELDREIEVRRAEPQREPDGVAGDHGDKGGSGDVVHLLQQRREAQERLAELEAMGESGGTRLLDAAASSELRALDEQLEDLTATLEFRNSAIGELRQSLDATNAAAIVPSSERLEQQLAHMSLPVARRVLHANLGRMIEFRQAQREASRRIDEAAVTLQERETELSSTQQALRQARVESDRLLEQSRRERAEHERLMADAVRQTQRAQQQAQQQQQQAPTPSRRTDASATGASSPPTPSDAGSRLGTPASKSRTEGDGRSPAAEPTVEALGMDNFYYKQANRELRRKLKDAASYQQKLEAELANVRAYLSLHPGATPTRVTKAALKEIDSADMPPLPTGVTRTAWGEGNKAH